MESSYRLALAGVVVALIGTGAVLRARYGTGSSSVSRGADGPVMALTLGLGGIAFYGSLLAYVVRPRLLDWSDIGLPAAVRWAGLAALAAGAALALWARHTLIALDVRTRREERLLVERFGDAYRRHMERTGRWLPRWSAGSPAGG